MRFRRRPPADPDWRLLEPAEGRCWLDLVEPGAADGIRLLHAMLDAGLLEAWQDRAGHVRLRSTGLVA